MSIFDFFGTKSDSKTLQPSELAEYWLKGAVTECKALCESMEQGGGSCDHVAGQLLREALAFYQFLILIQATSHFKLQGTDVNLLGGDLCSAIQELGNTEEWSDLKELIDACVDDPAFHRVVAGYMRGDTSVSRLEGDDFSVFCAMLFMKEEQQTEMLQLYAAAFARMMSAVIYDDEETKPQAMELGMKGYTMFTWLAHTETTIRFSEMLKKLMESSTRLGGGNPEDLPTKPVA